jgi:hypothetical protein
MQRNEAILYLHTYFASPSADAEAVKPTATYAKKQAFVSIAIPPTLRQRAVNALQSGKKAAIEEFLDNPYVNVAIAIIEGWRNSESEA